LTSITLLAWIVFQNLHSRRINLTFFPWGIFTTVVLAFSTIYIHSRVGRVKTDLLCWNPLYVLSFTIDLVDFLSCCPGNTHWLRFLSVVGPSSSDPFLKRKCWVLNGILKVVSFIMQWIISLLASWQIVLAGSIR
jgi:hypothetical protein